MQLFDPNNPGERKKALVAAILAIVALAVLGYVFLGSSGSSSKKPQQTKASPTPPQASLTADNANNQDIPEDPRMFTPVVMIGYTPPFSEANRNIFAYYEPTPTPVPVKPVPTPTPPPPPPLTLSSLAPANVYARTADFSLEAMGDKFTPAVRIAIDGRDLPSRFINPQQIAATVSASLISTPGARQVMVRSADGKLYSNVLTLNVMQPPVPNYNYVGIIGKLRANDVAVLFDKGTKDLLNVQRGDVLGGRFRVTSISERELVLTDTTLKIKHTLPFTTEGNPAGPIGRPTPRVVVDDEP